jgi:signal transduction histidine kinase
MTFRARVLIASIVVALAPLIVLTIGIRREVDRALTAQYRARVQELVAVIREDMARQNRTVDARLSALASGVAADARVRAAVLLGQESPAVLDWAGRAMPLAGLDYLMLLDPSGRILSSGHFRNEYDRHATAVDSVLRTTDGPVLVRARTAEGSFLALARGYVFEMGGRRFLLAGGIAVDQGFLDRLARQQGAGDPSVMLLGPGGVDALADSAAAVDAGVAPGNAGSPPPSGAGPGAMRAELALPFLDDATPTPVLDTARVVVTHSLAPLAALERRMDLWFGGGLVVVLLLALLIAHAVSTRVSRPLAELAGKTRRLNLDRLDVDFRSTRLDEIGTLSRLMGAMVERLKASVVDLRQAERRATVGDLARQVNHDIRNGLVPIRNVVRHLAEVAGESPDELAPVFAERQGTLDGGIAYLESLASTYARLSPRAERRPTDVNEVARGVVRDAVVPTGARLRTGLAEPLPRVAADPVVLRRIIENLVVNALESLEGPGEVVVGTFAEGGPQGARVVLTVEDTGRGVEPTQLERIFEDFFSTKPDGTGLGLSIVQRLVADLGGRIDVRSEPGRGTRFRVELPSLEGSAGAHEEAR